MMWRAHRESTPVGSKYRIALCAGLMVCLPVLTIWAVCRAVGDTAQLSEQQATVQTLLRGLEHREPQLSRLVGEAVVDTYFGQDYWSSLAEMSDVIDEGPEGWRDRDRVLVRFDLSHTRYRCEAQNIYWGGANMFFSTDPSRQPQDVGQLYLVRGTTESGLLFEFSRQSGYPLVSYEPISDTSSGFCRGRPSRWLGLRGVTHEPLSAWISTRLRQAGNYECITEKQSGISCHKLTVYHRNKNSSFCQRIRYWFAPQYGCALVKKERIGFEADHPHGGYRYVTEWSHFEEVPDLGCALPRRYVHWAFNYATDSGNPLDHVLDVHVTRLATQPPPPSDVVEGLCPPGTRLRSEPIQPELPSGAARSPEWQATKRMAFTIWNDTHFWAEKPWDDVVPPFPQEWPQLGGDTITDILSGAQMREAPKAPSND